MTRTTSGEMSSSLYFVYQDTYSGFTSTGVASSSPVFYLSYLSHSSITKFFMALGNVFGSRYESMVVKYL